MNLGFFFEYRRLRFLLNDKIKEEENILAIHANDDPETLAFYTFGAKSRTNVFRLRLKSFVSVTLTHCLESMFFDHVIHSLYPWGINQWMPIPKEKKHQAEEEEEEKKEVDIEDLSSSFLIEMPVTVMDPELEEYVDTMESMLTPFWANAQRRETLTLFPHFLSQIQTLHQEEKSACLLCRSRKRTMVLLIDPDNVLCPCCTTACNCGGRLFDHCRQCLLEKLAIAWYKQMQPLFDDLTATMPLIEHPCLMPCENCGGSICIFKFLSFDAVNDSSSNPTSKTLSKIASLVKMLQKQQQTQTQNSPFI
jgi:hypothetical protein